MPKRPALVLACALLLPWSTTGADSRSDARIQVLAENLPPFAVVAHGRHYAKDADIGGPATDIVRELFKRSGIEYQLSTRYPGTHLYRLVRSTPNSAVYPFALSTGRKPQFKWVGPLASDSSVLVALGEKKFTIKQIEDAAAYRIGAYKDSYEAEFLARRSMPYSESEGLERCLQQLQSGQIDLWAFGNLEALELARQKGLANLKVVKVLDDDKKEYLALNPNTPDEVVKRLQDALDQMRQDGTLDKISQAYLEK